MTILFMDQFSELGGAQLCLLDLMPAILQRGWQARVALPGDGPLVRRLQDLGVPVARIPCGPYHSGHKTALDAIRFVRDSALIAHRLDRADVIYVNGPRLLPAVAAARLDCPVLFHAHSFLDKTYAARMARWAIRITQALVISPSQYSAAALRNSPVRLIENGVGDCRRVRIPHSGPTRIGVVGRIAPEKGQLEFVRAARLLLTTNADCRFIVCGAPSFSDPLYASRVRSEARGLPVEFRGWQDDVAAVLSQLDVVVVPSIGNDAVPRIILESFSAEVPVVAFATGGIPELIDEGVTGFLASPPSPQSLAAVLRHALAADLRAVCASGRAAWARRFTLGRYQDEVCAAIEGCFRSRSRRNNTAANSAASAAIVRGSE